MHDRISDAELAIMEALWNHSPLTATEVAARVANDREWSLAMVKTLLSRLVGYEKNSVPHNVAETGLANGCPPLTRTAAGCKPLLQSDCHLAGRSAMLTLN